MVSIAEHAHREFMSKLEKFLTRFHLLRILTTIIIMSRADTRIAEFLYKIALLPFAAGVCGSMGNTGPRKFYTHYECSFCLRQTPILHMHSFIQLEKNSRTGQYEVVVGRFGSTYVSSSKLYVKNVCFDCIQKCNSYVKDNEYRTWNIRVSDIMQLFDSKERDNNVLPVSDLWHIVMQYTNPRYITLENRKNL